jgi:hypothetical protein
MVTLTAAVVVAVVFMVRTMIQVRKTAKEAETLLNSLNYETNKVKAFTETFTSFVGNFINSPWLKFGTLASSVATGIFAGLRKKHEEKSSN